MRRYEIYSGQKSNLFIFLCRQSNLLLELISFTSVVSTLVDRPLQKVSIDVFFINF